MRARLALAASGVQVELREILLRDKPSAFLAASPSGTVPCLQTGQDIVDESLDIMIWALRQNDPDHWLDMPTAGHDLITCADGPFKTALDHTKYASRYPDLDADAERQTAATFLYDLDTQLSGTSFLFADHATLADMAILPFVRQFAFIDKAWFDAQPWPHLLAWLERFLASAAFAVIMPKYPPWVAGEPPTFFPN